MANVATGMPLGICTMECSESSPRKYLEGTGTPRTGTGTGRSPEPISEPTITDAIEIATPASESTMGRPKPLRRIQGGGTGR